MCTLWTIPTRRLPVGRIGVSIASAITILLASGQVHASALST